jgi:predicted nucleic acid-binding protein
MATMAVEQAAEALFVDTNVLVYANVAEAPQHAAALAAISRAREAGRTLWISRQVLREYLATLTRPQAFASVPRATVLEQARWFAEHFEMANDTAAVAEQLLRLMATVPVGGKQVHDANIVATMIAYRIPALLTHNEPDFKQFARWVRVQSIA